MSLTIATDSTFVMAADSQNVVTPGSRGRKSIRISSYNAYDESVILLDVKHMPEGCGTWPAFWTLSQKGPWPKGGEIDIVEGTSSPFATPTRISRLTLRPGVNQATQNLASLHTDPYCVMPQQRFQTGYVLVRLYSIVDVLMLGLSCLV